MAFLNAMTGSIIFNLDIPFAPRIVHYMTTEWIFLAGNPSQGSLIYTPYFDSFNEFVYLQPIDVICDVLYLNNHNALFLGCKDNLIFQYKFNPSKLMTYFFGAVLYTYF